MRQLLKITTATIITLIITLITLNQLSMRTIQTEITINAKQDKVWNALMNHEEYSNWNPFIVHASGSTQVGELMDIEILQEDNKSMKFQPVVLKHTPNQEFRWRGKLFLEGLFDGEHYFKLEALEGNQTKLIHGEVFSGLLSGALLKMIGADTLKGFEKMNTALKDLVEKN